MYVCMHVCMYVYAHICAGDTVPPVAAEEKAAISVNLAELLDEKGNMMMYWYAYASLRRVHVRRICGVGSVSRVWVRSAGVLSV